MKHIFAKTLCVAALLTAVSAAQAAFYNFNVPKTSGGGTGWNVQLQTLDNISWNIIGIESLAGANAATAPASTIEFSFYDDLTQSNQILMVSAIGGTDVIGLNGGVWASDPFKFNTPLASRFLKPSGLGSTKFTGSFTLDNSLEAKYFTVAMQGPGFANQWTTSLIGVAPEMPGSVLLLAALIPVGFIARKRLGTASKIAV